MAYTRDEMEAASDPAQCDGTRLRAMIRQLLAESEALGKALADMADIAEALYGGGGKIVKISGQYRDVQGEIQSARSLIAPPKGGA